MAKPARGLPTISLSTCRDEKPVQLGDFLDEAPPVHVAESSDA